MNTVSPFSPNIISVKNFRFMMNHVSKVQESIRDDKYNFLMLVINSFLFRLRA